MTKQCNNHLCKKIKPLEEFYTNSANKDGYDTRCKDCRKENARSTRTKYVDKARKNKRDWYQGNKEHVAAYNAEYLPKYYKENREQIIKDTSRNTTLRRQAVPQAKLASNLRRRLSHALKGTQKSAKTLEILGCTFNELKTHLEASFVPGMTWENYGPVWHVDHIKPLALFDLTRKEQLMAAGHWTNLQPMFAVDNIRKRDKYKEPEVSDKKPKR